MTRSRLAARFAGGRTSTGRLAPLLLALAQLSACGSSHGEPARPDDTGPDAPPAATRADLPAPAATARHSNASTPDSWRAPEAQLEVPPEPVALAGVVLGPDGGGVPGVGLRVRRHGTKPVELSTGDDGRFEHWLPAPGGAWIRLDERTLPEGLLARQGGRALAVDRGVRLWLEPPLAEPLVIELVESATVEGRLALPDGTPVARGEVELEPLDEGGLRREASVRPDGRFTLEHLHPARYRLQLDWWIPWDRAAPVPAELVLEPGRRAEVELVLGAGPCALDGRVLGSDGRGYAGGSVEVVVEVGQGSPVGLARSTIDEQGRYAVEGLPAGRVLVQLPSCPGTGYDEMPAPLSLDLEPGAVARLPDQLLDCTAADLAEFFELMKKFE